MNKLTSIKSLLTLVFALSITGCASTKPVGEWRSESFTGQVDNVLVVGVTSRSTRRRVFEDKFVEALAAVGVNAVPSYTLITSTPKLSRDTVAEAVRQNNLDAVLVTRLVGVQKEEVYRLPSNYDHYRSFHGYYDHAWQQTSQGYYSQYRVLTLETNLYDVASEELVWSMQSETMDASQPRHIIEEQIKLTIGKLSQQGILAAKP